ncbi:hypothetical protein ACS5PN_25715 [Roseateles sp. NT4]|uniref:hypothetical protein n=1 Tax=Roseateles sp. NT4 TaxID=3453715 RepID=UPI003EEE1924
MPGNPTAVREVLEAIATQSGPRLAEAQDALGRLIPEIKQVVAADPSRKDDLLDRAAAVQELLRTGDAAGALRKMAELSALLAPARSAGKGPGSGAAGFERRWADARASWREAVEAVDARIAKVRAQMLSSGNPDLLDIADRGMPALTDNHKTPVSVAVIEVADSSGEKRERSARKAIDAIQAFRSHIDTDPMIKVLDEQSPAAFGVSLAIRTDIGRGLTALESVLRESALA